ncbi:hypothetical protein [Bacillus sp. EB01]|uniref:hypothetical protein n=1 Tax=Bacillus sp. EB01 TaxID=1347086 RepID=UPI000B040A7F|nr:hypothetical protein [Bacillus sp. EB01]
MVKKVFKIKILPSLNGKSSDEVVNELVKQTIDKVLSQNKNLSYTSPINSNQDLTS